MLSQAVNDVHGQCFMQICTEVNARHANNGGADEITLWHAQNMVLSEKIKGWLQKRYPNQSELGRLIGVDQSQVGRLYKGQNVGYQQVMAMLEASGAKIVFPDEERDTTREICWVNAKRVGAENGAHPEAENYFAVPLAKGSVAAGPGLVPEDEVRGWLLVYRHQGSVRYKSNLVAVEIGQGQESMAPTLHPEDIVLIDKDVRSPDPQGSIFLVRDRDDDVAIKRVTIERRKGDTWLAYSSDNPDKRTYPPRFFNLEEDFGNDISRAIVGRVIWAWKDMTRK